MAKVLGVHEVELGADGDPAEFERLAAAAMAEARRTGSSIRLFKADRVGERQVPDAHRARQRRGPGQDLPDRGRGRRPRSSPSSRRIRRRARRGIGWTSYVPPIDVGTDYVEIDG